MPRASKRLAKEQPEFSGDQLPKNKKSGRKKNNTTEELPISGTTNQNNGSTTPQIEDNNRPIQEEIPGPSRLIQYSPDILTRNRTPRNNTLENSSIGRLASIVQKNYSPSLDVESDDESTPNKPGLFSVKQDNSNNTVVNTQQHVPVETENTPKIPHLSSRTQLTNLQDRFISEAYSTEDPDIAKLNLNIENAEETDNQDNDVNANSSAIINLSPEKFETPFQSPKKISISSEPKQQHTKQQNTNSDFSEISDSSSQTSNEAEEVRETTNLINHSFSPISVSPPDLSCFETTSESDTEPQSEEEPEEIET
ncbi:unnamed protein product [Orchesella dallaii]|uniref:Uncharacterized protein n=1 Tax=Orchesella dallaii TaxID=48710 RepID=A0ABP1QXX1_9HEXA